MLFYKDGKKEGESKVTTSNSYANESVVSQEYILLFGHYYHRVSHTGVELLNLRIRRKALPSTDLEPYEEIKCKFIVPSQRALLSLY